MSMEFMIWRNFLSFVRHVCLECRRGSNFPWVTTKLKKCLSCWYTNIFGPMDEFSIGGSHYFITFIDDFSQKSQFCFMRKKTDALEIFRTFISFVERKIGKKVKALRSNNGGEYCSNELDFFFQIQQSYKEEGHPTYSWEKWCCWEVESNLDGESTEHESGG